MELNFSELRDLLAALNQTDISELILKSDEFELTVRKGAIGGDRTVVVERGTSTDAVTAAALSPTPVATPAPSAAPAPAPAPTPLVDQKLVDIISPMVGTFYRSPAPDEPSYVDVGDRIRTGQVVCIIEAMKLMNELDAEVSGEIVEILVQNGEPVEYGQTLMRVNPA